MKNRKQIFDHFLSCGSITTDTRSINNGQMFFALKGTNFDGNTYAKKAIDLGASLVIIDDKKINIKGSSSYLLVENVMTALQFLASDYRDYLNIPVIGITGSNGKTTTKELINIVLQTKYKVHATAGNFNNHIGVPLTILSAPINTEIMIVEMGANFQGEIEELCLIAKPTIGLITNISAAHMEGFGTFDTIIETKTALYRYLDITKGVIYVNRDEKILISQSQEYTNNTYYHPSTTLKSVNANPNITWEYTLNDKVFIIKSNIVGNYNLPNISAAIEVGLDLGINISKIVGAIESYTPSNNRSQLLEHNTNKYILDAYNANLSSMTLSIENMVSLIHEKKILILGDMLELGPIEKEAHQEIVDLIAHNYWEAVYLVGSRFSKTDKNSNFNYFMNVNDLKSFLTITPLKDALILLKGSRGIALEKILNSN